MYRVTTQIINNNEIIGYILEDKQNNQIRINSKALISYINDGVIEGYTLDFETNTILGFPKLSDLPAMNYSLETTYNGQDVYTGDKLVKNINLGLSGIEHERECIKTLLNWVESDDYNHIAALYGLRRTGKTVLMFQTMKHLINSGNRDTVAFISFDKHANIVEAKNQILSLIDNGYKYIFLDEITYVDGFIDVACTLADSYAKSGVKIVVAGTNSYILNLASDTTLYDRVVTIHTTFISYKEFKTLFPKTSIYDYMRLGGVLGANTFYDNTTTRNYIMTSLSDNIVSSIEKVENYSEYRYLGDIIKDKHIRDIIERIAINSNSTLIADILNEDFTDPSIKSAKQLVLSFLNKHGTAEQATYAMEQYNSDYIDDVLLSELVVYLKIGKSGLNIPKDRYDELESDILTIFDKLDSIVEYRKHSKSKKKTIDKQCYVMVQPGIRYNHTMQLIDELFNGVGNEIDKYYLKLLITKLKQDAEGKLLEQLIITDFIKRYQIEKKKTGRELEVSQIRYMGNAEIDIVVYDEINNNIYLYEVKRSDEKDKAQRRWLIDSEMNNFVRSIYPGNIVGRFVLYNGVSENYVPPETKTEDNPGGTLIKYRNIEEFLMR